MNQTHTYTTFLFCKTRFSSIEKNDKKAEQEREREREKKSEKAKVQSTHMLISKWNQLWSKYLYKRMIVTDYS